MGYRRSVGWPPADVKGEGRDTVANRTNTEEEEEEGAETESSSLIDMCLGKRIGGLPP